MTGERPTAVVERRGDTLRALASGPASTTDVATRIDASRSTADRALRELSTAGFVTRSDEGYRLTTAGQAALDAHHRQARRIDGAAEAAALFDGVDLGFDVDPAVFEGARVVQARPHAPNRPVECVNALVADATHVSVYTGRVLSRYTRIYHDRLRDGMSGTFVAPERVFERQSALRADDWDPSAVRGRIARRYTDRDAPVTLVLAETPDGPAMGLVVFRDEAPRGFLGTDAPAATRWARALHERVWADADPD
ncbi:Predicted transcriptional regulator, contains HTH domain [Haloplanus vescus]|uniref:Predicted transcriptional regulator, contains HTH domain n=1 Tax=Haloplanus vescus TaxID=555874 RepID=A0A1H3Y989_9EURY|nr:helix-turn-helix domain-containing protein [Haloplanus vescus]SEA07514.1 Predicted transcriptional regulator, contains HTH domain [Haloplanus vescus]